MEPTIIRRKAGIEYFRKGVPWLVVLDTDMPYIIINDIKVVRSHKHLAYLLILSDAMPDDEIATDKLVIRRDAIYYTSNPLGAKGLFPPKNRPHWESPQLLRTGEVQLGRTRYNYLYLPLPESYPDISDAEKEAPHDASLKNEDTSASDV